MRRVLSVSTVLLAAAVLGAIVFANDTPAPSCRLQFTVMLVLKDDASESAVRSDLDAAVRAIGIDLRKDVLWSPASTGYRRKALEAMSPDARSRALKRNPDDGRVSSYEVLTFETLDADRVDRLDRALSAFLTDPRAERIGLIGSVTTPPVSRR
jgi:hypothetical protein